jgi:hypothetical protein
MKQRVVFLADQKFCTKFLLLTQGQPSLASTRKCKRVRESERLGANLGLTPQ